MIPKFVEVSKILSYFPKNKISDVFIITLASEITKIWWKTFVYDVILAAWWRHRVTMQWWGTIIQFMFGNIH